MNVFITGATGYIGSAIAGHLKRLGHAVFGLARTLSSAERLKAKGHQAIVGDMAHPERWLSQLSAADAVIHTAATFDEDMAKVEACLLDGLLIWAEKRADESGRPVPFVYTGGCWLYGPVGDKTATEGTPFDPLPGFSFMVAHRERLFGTAHLRACTVHPAIVWDETGGAIADFIDDAKAGKAPRVYGASGVRWPLVHRGDLARLYARALEAGRSGADYHGAAERGTLVHHIASAIAREYGAPAPEVRPVAEAITAFGSSGAGLALDQTMEAPLTRAELGWLPRQPPVLEALSRA